MGHVEGQGGRRESTSRRLDSHDGHEGNATAMEGSVSQRFWNEVRRVQQHSERYE